MAATQLNPMIANYRNLIKQDTDFLGGYLTFCGLPFDGVILQSADYRRDRCRSLQRIHDRTRPGWRVFMYMQGETIPKESNHVRLSPDLKDPCGIPQLITSVGYDDNDEKMLEDFLTQSKEMLERPAAKMCMHMIPNRRPDWIFMRWEAAVWAGIPKTSMLNKWNQLHHCQNVFVTDGACMTSTGNQSPSIFYMAFFPRRAITPRKK